MDAVGLTFAVQCGDSPLYVKGYGSAELDPRAAARAGTVYEIGSVSKQFVAAAIMKLAHAKLLSLDDAIGAYLLSHYSKALNVAGFEDQLFYEPIPVEARLPAEYQATWRFPRFLMGQCAKPLDPSI